MNIAPIETSLYGYRFRSRTEARWAIFLTHLRVNWLYEREGFNLPSGRYLPDFWVPNPMPEWPSAGYWLEVKGEAPTEQEQQLALQLAHQTNHTTTILVGDPGSFYTLHAHRKSTALEKTNEGCPLTLYRLLTHNFEPMNRLVENAVQAARSARFEHGESPETKQPRSGNLTGVVSQFYK